VRQLTIAKCRSGSRTTDLRSPRDVRFSPDSDRVAALWQPGLGPDLPIGV